MRRWFAMKRPTCAPDPRPWDRCVLAVEQLETRENPAPLIFPPDFAPEPFPQTLEDTAVSFEDATSFSVINSAAFANVHRATLTAADGTITVGAQAGVTVSGNGTSTVVLTGLIGNINSLIVNGFTYTPTGFSSGEDTVQLSVTDLGVDEQGNPTTPTGTDTESFTIRVRPVASPAVLSVNASGEVLAPSGTFPLPPNLLTITSWPDADGSETATVSFSLDAANPGAFRLFASANELSALEPGLWRVDATSQPELQALLDSLVLVPPDGFSGRATLSVFGSLVDTAVYPSFESGETTEPPQDLIGGSIDLRFFLGTNVTLSPPPTAPEGGTIDLGGAFVGSDPDLLPGDTSVFTITAPAGLLTFRDSALVSGMSADRAVAADGSTTITLTGDLNAINAFLAAAGGLMYSAPDPDFSGSVPLAVTLANRPGAPASAQAEGGGQFAPLVVPPQPGEAPGKFGGIAPVRFAPEADGLFPLADDAVTTQDTPVAVLVGFAAAAARDASEAVLLVVRGVPDGAFFTAGTDLGGGAWALAVGDLVGLVFVPPPGAVGVFDLSVTAVVTDSDPETGETDSATHATAFTITVLPAAVPLPDGDPDPDPPDTPGFIDFDFDDEVEDDFEEADDGGDDAVTDVSADPDGETADRPDELDTEPVVLAEGIASVPADSPTGPSEGRVGLSAPGAGSLFANPEPAQLAYGGNEKHPLPPVLPLDQSASPAGFTESGGDSFGLIDKLLRGDATAQAVEPAAPELAAAPDAGLPKPDPNAGGGAVAPGDEVAENEWRYWVAGTAFAGATAAWALLSAERARLARAARRLIRPTRRPVPAEIC